MSLLFSIASAAPAANDAATQTTTQTTTQTAPHTMGGFAGLPLSSTWFLLIAFLVIFYFLIIRPQTKRAKQHKDMIAAIKTGDEIVTAGGIYGRVKNVEDSFIVIEIATNTEITLQKSSIGGVLPNGTIKNF